MSENQSEAGKGLGIASLVLGILALVISFIPCLGMYAIFPGIIAIILGAIAFMQANKAKSPKGLIIAALVISILGTAIAGWQYAVLSSAASNLTSAIEDATGKDINDLAQDIQDAQDSDANDMDDLQEDLNNISDAITEDSDNEAIKELNLFIEDKDYDKAIDLYETTVDSYISNLKELSEGNLNNLGDNVKAVAVVSAVTLKIATVEPFFNEAQEERFQVIQKKYDEMEKK